MCGRFTQNYAWQQVHQFLSVFGAPQNLRPHYNIAPTTMIDVVRLDREGKRELVSMRWGLLPYFWKKTLKDLPATFNARAETVAERPMFRDASGGVAASFRLPVSSNGQDRRLTVSRICSMRPMGRR
jgi:putative SOS response-associated peptidase YedK